MGRKEFSAAHGLSVATLDAWRRRVTLSEVREEIVPVEIVTARGAQKSSMRAGGMQRSGQWMDPSRQFRVVLARGLRVEVEPGFDAAELRWLIAALDSVELRDGLQPPV